MYSSYGIDKNACVATIINNLGIDDKDNDNDVNIFLDLWYLQTLKYTTQDQIGFSYVCQKTNLIPLTLPNNEVYGDCPHFNTMFFIKHNHGC